MTSALGLTWVLGILAAFKHTAFLWYPFVLFNSLQGKHKTMMIRMMNIIKITISSKLSGSFNTLVLLNQIAISFTEHCPIAKSVVFLLSDSWMNQSQPEFLPFSDQSAIRLEVTKGYGSVASSYTSK